MKPHTTLARLRAAFAVLVGGFIMLAAEAAGATPAVRAYVPNLNAGSVSVIDVATHTIVATIPVGHGPYGVTVSNDGAKAYVTNQSDNTVSVIDTGTNAVTATFAAPQLPQGLVVSPDGSTLYVSGFGLGELWEVSTATGAKTFSATVGSNASSVAITPDGSTVYVGSTSTAPVSPNFGSVFAYSTATHAVVHETLVKGAPTGLAVSPTGDQVFVAERLGGQIVRISTATNAVLSTSVATQPWGVAASKDGSRYYVSIFGGSGALQVFSSATGAFIANIPVGVGPVGVSVSPDGATAVVTNSIDGTASLVSTATNTVSSTVTVGNTPFSIGNSMALPLAPPIPVPTLSEAALALLALVLAAAGGLMVRARGVRSLAGSG